MKNLITIALLLHLQTELELRVTPDLVVYDTRRFLCCKYQMNAKASSDTGGTNKLLHEVRLFCLKFRKLIYKKYQVRKRNLCPSLFIQLYVIVDLVNFVLGKKLLPLDKFRLDRLKRSVYLLSVNVCNSTVKVWQVLKLVRHTTTLKVDDDETYIVRMEQSCY